MTLKVNEIFKSIQGEGPATGEPVTFIRFHGCNLNCQGCDTDHSQYTEMTVDQVVGAVEQSDLDVVVLTGGEPFLQAELPVLISELYERGYLVDVETNGTISVRPGILRQLRYVVCSPKRHTDIQLNLKGKYLKFVVSKEVTDPPWTWPPYILDHILKDPRVVEETTVYLMPYGTTMEDAGFVWDLALQYKVRYSDRLQWRVSRR